MRLSLVLFVVIVTEAREKYAKLKQNTMSDSIDEGVVRNLDVFEDRHDLPVPFGHIFREGYEDPMSIMKQPVDLLELDMRYLNNSEEAKLLTSDPKSIQRLEKSPAIIASPRDEYLYRKDDKRARDDSRGGRLKTNDSAPMWFDLPLLQLKNKETPKRPKIKNKVENIVDSKKFLTDTQLKRQPKMKTFADHSFNLQQRMPSKIKRINWTTCDEFGKGAKFHPKDIIGVQWVPFFVWDKNRSLYVNVHTFSFPKKTEVKFYRDVYTPYLNVTIDWNQPKLIMKVNKFEMLLIAVDRKGLFDGIRRIDIPEYVKQKRVMLPMKTLRMKTVGNYLAMMHCDYKFAQILAVSGEEPPTPGNKLSEAKILNFRGRGGPVSRNLENEELEARYEAEEKLAAERRKFLISDEPIPSVP